MQKLVGNFRCRPRHLLFAWIVPSRYTAGYETTDYGAHTRSIRRCCIYDPVCEHEENAACEDCLYISNIACDNGNHNLSRSTLYGGEFDGETIDGFFDV